MAGNGTQRLKAWFDFFLFTSLFLACCAVGMVYLTYLLFGLPVDYHYFGFTFFGTLCSYNFHWYLTPSSYSGVGKAAWSVRNKKLHLFLFGAALIGAAYYTFQLLHQWPWLLATAVLTFLYSAPMIPHSAAKFLQRIAIGKTIFLSFAWTHVTALLPLVLVNPVLDDPQILFVINRFFLIYAICILFDYRDRESDLKAGIRSVITQFEPAGVHRFFWGVLIAFYGSCAIMPFVGYSWQQTIALVIPGVLTAALSGYSLRHPGDYVFYGLLDGLMALSLPLLLLLS